LNDVLSPEEIAKLVAAAKEGGLPAKAVERRTRRPRRVRELDFTRPVKLAPDQQRRLERGHETFCRTAGTRLSAEFRVPIEFEIINVAQLTWTAALSDMPQPSIFGVIMTKPSDQAILLAVEQPLVFRMVERLVGGGGGDAQAARALTEIELALTRRTIASLLEQLSSAWNEIFGLTLELVDLETQVANVELAPPSEPTVVLTIETREEHFSSTMSLLIPYRSIASVASRLSGQFDNSGEVPVGDTESAGLVQRAMGGVEVEVRAEVGSVEMTIGEVLDLAEGSIVRLGAPAEEGVYVCAGNTRLHRAQPGRSGSRRAVEIVERLDGAA
jgi:flagellar motor switch protein FliM